MNGRNLAVWQRHAHFFARTIKMGDFSPTRAMPCGSLIWQISLGNGPKGKRNHCSLWSHRSKVSDLRLRRIRFGIIMMHNDPATNCPKEGLFLAPATSWRVGETRLKGHLFLSLVPRAHCVCLWIGVEMSWYGDEAQRFLWDRLPSFAKWGKQSPYSPYLPLYSVSQWVSGPQHPYFMFQRHKAGDSKIIFEHKQTHNHITESAKNHSERKRRKIKEAS